MYQWRIGDMDQLFDIRLLLKQKEDTPLHYQLELSEVKHAVQPQTAEHYVLEPRRQNNYHFQRKFM